MFKPKYMSKKLDKAMKAFNSELSQEELVEIVLSAPLPEVKDKAFSLLTMNSLLNIANLSEYRTTTPLKHKKKAEKMLREHFDAKIDSIDNYETAKGFLAKNSKFSRFIDKDKIQKKTNELYREKQANDNKEKARRLKTDKERIAFLSDRTRKNPEDFAFVYCSMSESARIDLIKEMCQNIYGRIIDLTDLLNSGVLDKESCEVCSCVLERGILINDRVCKILFKNASEAAKASYFIFYTNKYYGNPFWYKEDFADELVSMINSETELLRITKEIQAKPFPQKYAILERLGFSEEDMFKKGFADVLMPLGGDFAQRLTEEDADDTQKDISSYLYVRRYRDTDFSNTFLLRMAKDSESFVKNLIEYVFSGHNSDAGILVFLYQNEIFPDLIRAQEGRQLTAEREIEREYYHDEYRYEYIPATYFSIKDFEKVD